MKRKYGDRNNWRRNRIAGNALDQLIYHRYNQLHELGKIRDRAKQPDINLMLRIGKIKRGLVDNETDLMTESYKV